MSPKDFVYMPDMRFMLPLRGDRSMRATDRIRVYKRNAFFPNDLPALGYSPGEGLQQPFDMRGAPSPTDPEGEL